MPPATRSTPSHPSPLVFEKRGRTRTCSYRDRTAWPLLLVARNVYPGTDRLLAILTLARTNEVTGRSTTILTSHTNLLTAAQRHAFAKEATRRLRGSGQLANDVTEDDLNTTVDTMLDGLLEYLLDAQSDVTFMTPDEIEIDEGNLTPPYVLWPLVPASRPGMLVAPSGSGKSGFVQFAGLMVCLGRSLLPGVEVRAKGPVIYIGQEEQARQWKSRLVMTCRGHDVPVPQDYYYMKLSGSSLIDSAELIAEKAATVKAALVIIDSAQATWGDGGERGIREQATQWYNAVDEIGVPCWIVEHPNEQDRRKATISGAAGAGVKRDRVGHQWLMTSLALPRNDGEPYRYHVKLTDIKRNYVGQQPEITFETIINGFESTRYLAASALTADSIVDASGTWRKIAAVMRDPGPDRADFGWTATEVATEIGAKDDRRIRLELSLGSWRPNPEDISLEESAAKVSGTGTGRSNPTRYRLVIRPAHQQVEMAYGEEEEYAGDFS